MMKKILSIGLLVLLNGCGGDDDGITPELSGVLKEISIEGISQFESNHNGSTNYVLRDDGTINVLDIGLDITGKLSGFVDIKKFTISGDDTITALDFSGNVYVSGWNSSFLLGLDTVSHGKLLSIPEQNPYLENIIDICAGNDYVLALNEDGNIYSWGYGNNGSLGYIEEGYQETPKLISTLNNIDSISCGVEHSIALDANGEVFTWGVGDNGRLGLGDTDDKHIPTKINGLADITEVSAGSDFTLVLNKDDVAYGFGNGDNGRLSVGSNHYNLSQEEPELVTGVDNIKHISAGLDHSLFLQNDGDVYSAGNNSSSSKLGVSNNNYGDYELIQATKIPNLSNIASITAGPEHSLFIDSNGKATTTKEQTITYPPSSSGVGACGGFVGNWTRADGTTVNIDSSCSGVITQYSLNTSDVMKTYISNISGTGTKMSYYISRIVIGIHTQDVNKTLSNIDYSVSGNKLQWGGYSYSK